MMGHREELKGGDEWDMFSTYWRKLRFTDYGRSHKVKKGFSRRTRRQERMNNRAVFNELQR